MSHPLLVNNKIVSDFTKKTNLFNDFFAAQCTPLTNSSVLSSTISFKNHSRPNYISFEKEDILKIIGNFNVNKAHGHDDIRMLKICDSELVEPLSLIYKNCIDSGIFPDIWKRCHIISTYKIIVNIINNDLVHHIYANFDHNPSLQVRGLFWISQKHLMKYGMKDCYTNLNLLVYRKSSKSIL